MLRQTLDKDYDISAVSAEDAEAVRLIAGAIGRRAARLAAVAIAGTIINTGRLDKSSGSATTEQKSGIEPPRGDVREALRAIPEIGAKGEKRVRIGIAKDGSGVGAALIALVAGKVGAPQ